MSAHGSNIVEGACLVELACFAAVKMRSWTEGMPDALRVALAAQQTEVL